MRGVTIGFLAFLGASCNASTAVQDLSSASEASREEFPVIEHRITSWGRTINRSVLTSDGRIVLEDFDFSTGQTTSRKTAVLSPPAHREAVKSLKPLRNNPNRIIFCDNVPTDQASGHFTWDGTNEYSIYYPCSSQFPQLMAAEEAYWDIINAALATHDAGSK